MGWIPHAITPTAPSSVALVSAPLLGAGLLVGTVLDVFLGQQLCFRIPFCEPGTLRLSFLSVPRFTQASDGAITLPSQSVCSESHGKNLLTLPHCSCVSTFDCK